MQSFAFYFENIFEIGNKIIIDYLKLFVDIDNAEIHKTQHACKNR